MKKYLFIISVLIVSVISFSLVSFAETRSQMQSRMQVTPISSAKKLNPDDIKRIMNAPVTDNDEINLSKNIKNCTPSVQISSSVSSDGTLTAKKMILGYSMDMCHYKEVLNNKTSVDCYFPKSVLPKLADVSTKQKHLNAWSDAFQKYCKYANKSAF